MQPYTDAGYDEETSIYRGLMTHADDAFGQIMAALEEAKLDKNTVIVFSGDVSISHIPRKNGEQETYLTLDVIPLGLNSTVKEAI